MPTVKVLTQTGESAGTMKLDDTVFAVEYNEPVIHQAVVAQLNNARQGTKCALTRTEVSGGGRKPWRQKGTGNARQGSTRSPQWKGGGVVFAPKPRDFSQKVNKLAKRYAFLSALSARVSSDELIVVDKIELKESKTKEVCAILSALKAEGKGILLVTRDNCESVERASANIEGVKSVPDRLLSVYDIVASQKIIATKDAVKYIEDAYKVSEEEARTPKAEKKVAEKTVAEKKPAAEKKVAAEKKPTAEKKATAEKKPAAEKKATKKAVTDNSEVK